MKWYHGFEAITEENVSLRERTWYRLGGPARYLCRPISVEQVRELVQRCRQEQLPLKVLGVGANVLVRDEGFEGVVIQLDKQAFGQVHFEPPGVRAGASTDLTDLIRLTVHRNLAGLEFLAGIPGSVGGALRMNAGGKFGEISQSVVSVRLIDEAGRPAEWDRRQLIFSYRHSNLANTIVLEATFELHTADAELLNHRYREIWDYKKATQPFTRNNAGCTFKNPPGLFAGQLIERAGLKGMSIGGATVSPMHANFITADPQTTSADILTLIDHIQHQVHDKFDVRLETEIDVW
ncbi:MAG: UDP-N-acetylenolpyruvoylglucosamine reductase [Phycisphaerae bacterium]|nr:UDP-N-acetylenolpyruvoylglucosamine reductase [Phycisphaerae bacterium]